jgi:hypothetical protein
MNRQNAKAAKEQKAEIDGALRSLALVVGFESKPSEVGHKRA